LVETNKKNKKSVMPRQEFPYVTVMNNSNTEGFEVWWPDYNPSKTHLFFIVTVRGQHFQVILQVPPPRTIDEPFPVTTQVILALRPGLHEEMLADVGDTLRLTARDFMPFAISPFQLASIGTVVNHLLIVFPNGFDRGPGAEAAIAARIAQHQRRYHNCEPVVRQTFEGQTIIGCTHNHN
jgi:hypothetical protein